MPENLQDSEKSTTFALANEKYRGVEQLVARQAHNLEVACSSPASATNNDITSCKNNELCRFFVLYCDKSATKLRDQIILWRIKYCCVFNGSNNKTFFYLYHKYCKTNCKTKKKL